MAFFHDAVAPLRVGATSLGLRRPRCGRWCSRSSRSAISDTVPWHLTSRQVDCYFAGPGKRAHRTIRQKMVRIDAALRLPGAGVAGEILRRFGAAVSGQSTRSDQAPAPWGVRPADPAVEAGDDGVLRLLAQGSAG